MASRISYKSKPTPKDSANPPVTTDQQADKADSQGATKQRFAKWRLSQDTQLRILPPIAIALSAISISICLYYASVFQTQLSQIDADIIEQLTNDLALQQQEQADLIAQFERYKNQTQDQIRQIETGQGQNPSAHIKQMLKVLEAQQQDYRGFLRVVRQGMIEVSQMTRGSREWTNDYINQMGRVNDKSLQRSQEIKAIDPQAAVKP